MNEPSITPGPAPANPQVATQTVVERPRTPMHPIMCLLLGVLTAAYLAWIGWISFVVISMGIPEPDRAGLVETIVLAGVGVVLTGLGGAAAANGQNPLAILSTIATSMRNIVRR